MEMQEQAINKETVGKALHEVFPIESDMPADFERLLAEMDRIEICREVELDITNQRLCRLLGNTANQSAK